MSAIVKIIFKSTFNMKPTLKIAYPTLKNLSKVN